MTAWDRPDLAGAFRARWYTGLRAGVSVGLPLLAGVAAGRPSWGALASMGSFAGFYGPDAPYPYRLRLAAGIGLTLTVAVPLSSLCAPVAWLSVLLCGAVAGVAAFACLALRVPPPREYLIVLALLAATGIPAGGLASLRDGALVAAGAVAGGLVSLSPLLAGRAAVPETRALTQARRAVRNVLQTAGTAQAARSRGHAVAAVGQARQALRQAGRAAAGRRLRSLAATELALAGALSASIDATAPLDAAAVRRVLAPAAAVLRGEDTVSRLDRPGVAARLRAGLRPDSVAVPAAARIAVTVAAGAVLGRVLGLDHAYWVPLTAASALQANNVTFLVRRALNRLAGTVAGILLAWAVFTAHPALAVVALVALAAQCAGEILISASYGLAVVLVTVVALSIYDLGNAQAQIATAIGARLIDTAVGVALVILLRLVLWRRAAGSRLPQAQARTLRSAAAVFAARWLGPAGRELEPARRQLEEDLVRLRTLTEDAVADAVLGARETQAEQVTLAVDELAMLALGMPYGRPLPPRAGAQALVDRLDQVATALQAAPGSLPGAGLASAGAGPAGPPGPVFDLPGYPRTRAAAGMLASAVTRSAAPVSD